MAFENWEAEAFGNEGCLVAIGTEEPDHFKGRALAERDNTGLGLGGAG